MLKKFVTLACCLSLAGSNTTQAQSLSADDFKSPPDTYGIGTWWHWIYGNISKEGITKDLESFSQQGIERATLFDVGVVPVRGPVSMMGEDWFAMVRHAAAEANRTGVKLGLHLAPGWSEAGGPWITPEMSMKRIVWTNLIEQGGRRINVELPPLPENLGWSKDIAVLAWPTDRTPSRMSGSSVRSAGQSIDGYNLWDGNPTTTIGIDAANAATRGGKFWELVITLPSAQEADRMELQLRRLPHHTPRRDLKFTLSGDNRPLAETSVHANNIQDNRLTLAFDKTTVREYKLTIEIEDPEDWITFRFLEISEATLLSGAEQPGWNPELLNLADQMADSAHPGNTGTPRWREGAAATAPVAADSVIDISRYVTDGRLDWQAPPGTWRIVRFGYTTTGKTNSPSRPGGVGLESDKMSAEATRLHFSSYISRILDSVKPEDRSVFDLVIADSWEAGSQNWTDDFGQQFAARRGYSLLPWMAVAAGEVVNSREQTGRFLNDFRETISDLMIERFYAENQKLANTAGLQFAAEIASGPDLDVFAQARVIDQPMDEFWADRNDGTILPPERGALSGTLVPDAARLAGKRHVPVEAFTSWRGDFRQTPGDYGFRAHKALAEGYTEIVLHSAVHQPDDRLPGFTLADHGPAFNRHNTWYHLMRDWSQELRRAQYLLRQGEIASDIMVYDAETMPRQGKLPALPGNTRPIRIDKHALLNRISVNDGQLQLDRKGDYKALIIQVDALSPESLDAIASLVKAGAVVIAQRPSHTPGLTNYPDADGQLACIADDLWAGLTAANGAQGKAYGKGRLYWSNNPASVLQSMGYQPAFRSTVQGQGQPLQYLHSRTGDADIFYLFNPNNTVADFTLSVANEAGRQPQHWNTVNGEVSPILAFNQNDARTEFPLSVAPLSATAVVFKDTQAPTTLHVTGLRSNAGDSNAFSAAPAVQLRKHADGSLWAASALGNPVFVSTSQSSTPRRVNFPQPQQLQLNGNWHISFGNGQSLDTTTLQSWTQSTNPQIRDYSGSAVYTQAFNLSAQQLQNAATALLDLGSVGSVARVTLNGHSVGTLWQAPWTLDVRPYLKEGRNEIKIEVANTWANQLIAEQSLPASERTLWTSWNTDYFRSKGATALASGLLQTPVLRFGSYAPLN